MTGWECPKCGRCYAPFVQQCSWCQGFSTLKIPESGNVPAHNCVSSTSNARCDICGGQIAPR